MVDQAGWGSHGGLTRGKLTPQQREEIRRRFADGETTWALALEFGVSAATIRNHTSPRS